MYHEGHHDMLQSESCQELQGQKNHGGKGDGTGGGVWGQNCKSRTPMNNPAVDGQWGAYCASVETHSV